MIKQFNHQDYQRNFLDIRRSHSTTGCLASAILILFGIGLDYLLYSDQLIPFFIARLLVASATVLIMFIIKYDITGKLLQNTTMLWLALPQIMISWMIFKSNGSASIYFVGLHLALYAVGIIVPLSYKEGLGFGVFTCACYGIACGLNENQANNLWQIIANSLFISFSAIISVICSYYNEVSRIKLFFLQKEVELQNAKLEDSNRNLIEIKGHMIQQEKMSALGTLSAGLLHELNNPVSYSMLAISMAQTEPEVAANELLKETLADAKEGMKRVADIVTDLKTFAYQKPGEDTKRVFLFENALRSALRLSSFELKDIVLLQDLPIDTHIIGDEPALIGVLINLATNAALALRKSGRDQPCIEIKAWHGVDALTGATRLYVTVRDNGTGVSLENINKIFEPFFTTRDVGQGLGLGLAVSYAIIQRHGSELKVKSDEGAWTEFSFDLPTNGGAQS
jgi:two-component system, sensor histidine kinase PhcS